MNLLQGVNRVLKRARLIQGESAELAALTSTAFQTEVDSVIDAWNEVIRYVYEHDNIDKALPHDTTEGTITLVTGTREYSLASDFEKMSSEVLVDQTNGYQVYPYPGGYKRMFMDQNIPATYTGRPAFWCINPTNGNLRFDQSPTADENGDVYTYLYEKRLVFDEATDNFPFSDTVAEELVPAVVQQWKMDTKPAEYNLALFQVAVSQAVSKLSNSEKRSHW